MSSRRRAILTAAKRCFARKGFHATTITDICKEAGVSAGGLYTHFEHKHAIVEAMGREVTEHPEPVGFDAMTSKLESEEGELDARLNLQLWAASSGDDDLGAMVHDALDALRASLADSGHDPVHAALLETLILGLTTQRALGRELPSDLDELLSVLRTGSPR